MSASFTRLEICLSSKWVGLLCGLLFLVSVNVAAGAQQPKQSEPQKAPAAAAPAEKKPNVVVFTLSGKPAPGKQWERPKGVPKMQPLSIEEKLKIAQGVHGIPALSAAAATPFLTLYPGHLYDPLGSLELGWPEWDRLGIAYYSLAIATPDDDVRDSLAKEEHAELAFKADAGNVYVVDFIVVIEVPTTSTGERDFELTVSGLTPSEVKAISGGNHLTAVFYVQTSGYYTARLGLKPKQNGGTYPRWGDWYFLATDVTKFVPAQ
jgi:hypothetical protein